MLNLVGLAGTSAERLALMNLASSAGIPIEAVNSAADFFVRKIEGWRDELVALVRGPHATIYRPSATLFLLLKIERLTAADLDDCMGLLEHCTATGEVVDLARVLSRLTSLPATPDAGRQARRAWLEASLRSRAP